MSFVTCGQRRQTHLSVIFLVVDMKLIGKGTGLNDGNVIFKVTSFIALLVLVCL